jgi:hypothetical protein
VRAASADAAAVAAEVADAEAAGAATAQRLKAQNARSLLPVETNRPMTAATRGVTIGLPVMPRAMPKVAVAVAAAPAVAVVDADAATTLSALGTKSRGSHGLRPVKMLPAMTTQSAKALPKQTVMTEAIARAATLQSARL